MVTSVQIPPPPAVAAEDGAGNKLRVLTHRECLRLLGHERLGRLAFTVNGQAKIFPVNYLLDGDTVVVRTGHGFKLAQAPMRRVAFEIDESGADGAWGWSVVVEGPCYNVTGALDEASARQRKLPVHPWAPGEREQWLRITPSHVSGRAFGQLPS